MDSEVSFEVKDPLISIAQWGQTSPTWQPPKVVHSMYIHFVSVVSRE
jgi:hypothetical protein